MNSGFLAGKCSVSQRPPFHFDHLFILITKIRSDTMQNWLLRMLYAKCSLNKMVQSGNALRIGWNAEMCRLWMVEFNCDKRVFPFKCIAGFRRPQGDEIMGTTEFSKINATRRKRALMWRVKRNIASVILAVIYIKWRIRAPDSGMSRFERSKSQHVCENGMHPSRRPTVVWASAFIWPNE